MNKYDLHLGNVIKTDLGELMILVPKSNENVFLEITNGELGGYREFDDLSDNLIFCEEDSDVVVKVKVMEVYKDFTLKNKIWTRNNGNHHRKEKPIKDEISELLDKINKLIDTIDEVLDNDEM